MKYLKKFKPIFFFILFCPLLASQCEKVSIQSPNTDNGLPPITTEGKHTFGCRVNGEVWIPDDDGILHDVIDISYHEPTGGLNIVGRRVFDDDGVFQSIGFGGWDIRGEGEYQGDKSGYNNYDTVFCANPFFDIDTMLYYKFNILRLDTENYIISGTFEFTAINDECDPVIITDGRFDLEY